MLLVGLILAVTAAACGGGSDSPTAPTQTGTWVANVPFSTTDITVGTGAEVATGMRVTVDYYGWLYNTTTSDNKGTLFDSSFAAGRTPLTFVVGAGQLIRGFEQGVIGMRVGGTRRVVMPPDLAYGATGNQSIPPNATLIFEIRVNSAE